MKSLLFVIALSTLFNNAKQQLSLQRDDRRLKLGNFRHLHGHRLNDQPRDTVELENEVQCISTCLRKQDCFSFNMKRTENSKFLCEFLNTSKYSNPTNLTRNDNYVHWYLQDPCLPLPRSNDGKCMVPEHYSDELGVNCACLGGFPGRQFEPNYNYALKKPTKQSSWTHNSWRAVDGNSATSWESNSCTHTYDVANCWWRVDFQEEIPVARIVITNRGDCCGYRLSDFEIKIGNDLVDEGKVNPKCGDRHAIGQGLTKTITCLPPLTGQYLVVQSFYNGALTICELEVYTNL